LKKPEEGYAGEAPLWMPAYAGMTIESVSRWVKAKNLFSIDIIQKGVHLYPLNREYR